MCSARLKKGVGQLESLLRMSPHSVDNVRLQYDFHLTVLFPLTMQTSQHVHTTMLVIYLYEQ